MITVKVLRPFLVFLVICMLASMAQSYSYSGCPITCPSGKYCRDGGNCCSSSQCGWGANECVSNGQTRSNQWAYGVCRGGPWKVVLNGWGCRDVGWECDQGVCVDNYCRLKYNGELCTSPSECSSGYCRSTVCCSSSQCGWGAENGHGPMCISSGGTRSNQYASGVCRGGTWKVVPGGVGCSGMGWACDNPGVGSCTNNYCPKADLAGCTSNSQCISGICSYGTCCSNTQCGWGAENGHGLLCINNGGTQSNQYASAVCRSGTWKVVLGGVGCSGMGWVCDQGFCDSSSNTCKLGYTISNLFLPSCKGAAMGIGIQKNIASLPDDNKVDIYVGSTYITSSYGASPPAGDGQAAYSECTQATGGPFIAKYTVNGQAVEQIFSTNTISSTCSVTSCNHGYDLLDSSVAYTPSFSNYLISNGKYIVCPGTSFSVSSPGTYNYLCNDGGVISDRGANLVAWVLDRFGRVQAQGDNGVTPSSRLGSNIQSTSTGCARDSVSSSLSLSDFSSAGRYTLYVDLITGICNSPSLFIRGWQNLAQYNVIVPGPSVNVYPLSSPITGTYTFTTTWVIWNNGIGDTTFSLSKNCGGLSCRFIGYTEGSSITLAEGNVYYVSMEITPLVGQTNTVTVTASYDDSYGLSCIAGGSTIGQLTVIGQQPTTTTRVSTTTTTTTTTTLPPGPKSVSFKYRVLDDYDTVLSCSLWTNKSGEWRVYETNPYVLNGTVSTFSLPTIAKGSYEWSINCTNSLGLSGWAENKWDFDVE